MMAGFRLVKKFLVVTGYAASIKYGFLEKAMYVDFLAGTGNFRNNRTQ
jgi:hypothetical protein